MPFGLTCNLLRHRLPNCAALHARRQYCTPCYLLSFCLSYFTLCSFVSLLLLSLAGWPSLQCLVSKTSILAVDPTQSLWCKYRCYLHRTRGVKLTSSAQVRNVRCCISTPLYGTVLNKIQELPAVTFSFILYRVFYPVSILSISFPVVFRSLPDIAIQLLLQYRQRGCCPPQNVHHNLACRITQSTQQQVPYLNWPAFTRSSHSTTNSLPPYLTGLNLYIATVYAVRCLAYRNCPL